MKKIAKPQPGEFPPYASMYIDLLPADGAVLTHLAENFKIVQELVLSLPADALTFSAAGAWTIKETLVHIIDDERIYAYRALCFARNDQTPLPGFEQDDYAASSGANQRDIRNILEEYEAVRNATVALFNGLRDADLLKIGTANGNQTSVRAMAYHIAGHELHHLKIMRERYIYPLSYHTKKS